MLVAVAAGFGGGAFLGDVLDLGVLGFIVGAGLGLAVVAAVVRRSGASL